MVGGKGVGCEVCWVSLLPWARLPRGASQMLEGCRVRLGNGCPRPARSMCRCRVVMLELVLLLRLSPLFLSSLYHSRYHGWLIDWA